MHIFTSQFISGKSSGRFLKLCAVFIFCLALCGVVPAFAASMSKEDFFMLCKNGTPGEIKAAIKNGANVNAEYEDGVTCLMRAAIRGNIGVIEVLIEAGADVNAKDKENMTPLLYAGNFEHLEALSILLKAGADPNAEYNGQTLRELAIQYDKKEIVSILDSYAAGASAPDAEIGEEHDMNIVEKYVNGLKQAYYNMYRKEDWKQFEKIKRGAGKDDIAKLKELFPDIPDTLVNLLEYVDGTYYRKYEGGEILFYLLGSDVDEYSYPYYLLSAEEMIENIGNTEYYAQCIEDGLKGEWPEIDGKITSKPDTVKWLHFSDCMNNGGTSSLYIDFSPSETGKKGQIIRFLHDPDEFKVIAESFDDYLQMLMDHEYQFINEDVFD